MPRIKDKEQANLWPAAALTTFIFVILIATGLVITFGVIQQLRYIAWERSLQQAEQSLAAEKELVRQTNELKQLLDQYTQNQLTVSEAEITKVAKARYDLIAMALPENPSGVAEILTDWSIYSIPATSDQHLEKAQVTSFTLVENLARKNDWYLSVINTQDNQILDNYSATQLQRGQNNIKTLFIINNISFVL